MTPAKTPATTASSIARHRGDRPDPLGFDALRELGIGWAQQASGRLWTDYNLHDPGVTLIEALCYALTEDVYAARQDVPTLLGLDPLADDAAWERFGLSRRSQQEPCRPLSERDWQLWLRQQLPQARQLQMRARLNAEGRFTGLWTLSLQDRGDDALEQSGLRPQALKAFWSRRNLAEDLAHPPHSLAPRWVALAQLRVSVTGERELAELLGELLQRCDDAISSRIPDSPEQDLTPGGPEFCDGPLGRPPHEEELQWLESRHPVLHPADLARHLGELPGIAGVEDLHLALTGEEAERAGSTPLPQGSLQRWGMDWALRLRWPDRPQDLAGWQVFKDGAAMRLDRGALLGQLHEWRRVMSLRRAGSGGEAVSQALAQPWPGFPAPDALPPLPAWRDDHLPATAALPPLYEQALQAGAGHGPGLRAQWTGYRALLEQGLLQVQVQREQLPRLYALDPPDSRSYWPGLPGEAQLPGLDALLQHRREHLPRGAWIDDEALERRHRLLDYQLALHGELLDHSALQGLPCYFEPQAWTQHLLRLKRRFARRLPRLTQERHAGADYSLPLLEHPDHAPPLQERLALQLGCLAGHSRRLSGALEALREHVVPEPDAEAADDEEAPHERLMRRLREDDERHLRPVLEAQSRARPLEGPPLGERLSALAHVLRQLGPDLDWLQAALHPQRFRLAGDRGPLLLLDDTGRHAWSVDLDGRGRDDAPAFAYELAQGLHELACLIQLHCEGLHLVEPLLLRPVGETREAGAAPDVDLYLVCTGWTARARDERYRELVQAQLMREAPAHLRCGLRWLDAGEMRAFETMWARWLGLRRRYCLALLAGSVSPRVADPLDEAGAALLRWLQSPGSIGQEQP